jgi:flagellar basal body rod protein FlgC
MQKVSMGGALAIAASGLAASAAWFGRIASNIVNAGNDAGRGALPSPSQGTSAATYTTQLVAGPTPAPDPATSLVDQSLALASYKASAAVFKAAEEMNKATLDLVA